MRRILLGLAPLSLFACTYVHSVEASLTPDPIMLDHVEPSRSFVVRTCWEGEAEPDEVGVWISASANGSDVMLDFADQREPLSETAPDSLAAPRQWWSLDDLDDACLVGTVVSFELEQGGIEPIEVEWSIRAVANSFSDPEIEALDVRIFVEAL